MNEAVSGPPLAQAPRQRFARRWLFRLTLLAGLAVTTEVGAYLAHPLAVGGWFSYSQANKERRVLLDEDLPDQTETVSSRLPLTRYTDIHPYLGFSGIPGVKAPWLAGENPVGPWGFTAADDRPPARKRAPGKVIVGILGASVASLFSSQGVGKLESELKRSPAFADKKIEFVNLAIGSHKQPQQLMALNYSLVLGGEFDLIINLDGFNDISLFALAHQVSDAFIAYPLGWPGFLSVVADPETPYFLEKLVKLQRQRVKWAKAFNNGVLRRSVTANLLWKLGEQHLAARQAPLKEVVNREARRLHHLIRGPGNTFRNESEMREQLTENWEHCSRLIDRLCKAHGIRYYHFLQPNQYVPGSKPLSQEEREYAYDKDNPIRTQVVKGYPLLRAAGQRLAASGIRFHDLSMSYERHPETYYYDECCHVNKAGAEALAMSIAAVLRETNEPPLATRTAAIGRNAP